jgi:cytochrome P450 monooxygenase
MRAALTPFFSRSSMREVEPVVVSIVDELVAAMATYVYRR